MSEEAVKQEEQKQSAKEQMEDLKGKEGVGEVITSSRTGKQFRVLPSSLDELPDLYDKFANLAIFAR